MKRKEKDNIDKDEFPDLKDGCLTNKWTDAKKTNNWGNCVEMRTDAKYRLSAVKGCTRCPHVSKNV